MSSDRARTELIARGIAGTEDGEPLTALDNMIIRALEAACAEALEEAAKIADDVADGPLFQNVAGARIRQTAREIAGRIRARKETKP
jgi:hypothetical protein